MQLTQFIAMQKLPQEFTPSLPQDILRKKLIKRGLFEAVTRPHSSSQLVGVYDNYKFYYDYDRAQTCYVLKEMRAF